MSKRKAKSIIVPAILETPAEITQNLITEAASDPVIETETPDVAAEIESIDQALAELDLDASEPIVLEQSETLDGTVVQTVLHADGTETVREVTADEAYGPEETSAEDTTGETVLEPEAPSEEMPSLTEVFASFDDETVTKTTHEISEALTEREKHELMYGDPNIQNVLKSARRGLVSKRAAKVFLAAHVDPDFINQSRSGAARYNAKGLLKIADIIKALTDGEIHNAVNIACMKSLFAFRRAGEPYTADLAKASVSDKIRITDAKIKALLVRHTVSQSTASTQASSTMNALVTLGVVRAEGSRNKPTYHLVDNPLTRQLEQVLFPKIAQEKEQENIAA